MNLLYSCATAGNMERLARLVMVEHNLPKPEAVAWLHANPVRDFFLTRTDVKNIKYRCVASDPCQ